MMFDGCMSRLKNCSIFFCLVINVYGLFYTFNKCKYENSSHKVPTFWE
jgi:hypothetical protein